jgi:Winged helix-turn helix
MLSAGWQAHTLNAPGKFLISAPEHTTPKRARAYLLTDDDVARVVAHYAGHRPWLDDVSGSALNLAPTVSEPVPWYLVNVPRSDEDESADTPDDRDTTTPEGALWAALCSISDEGADVAELMRMTGLGRSTVYRYLAQFADQGRAVQVGWGRWRAINPEGGHGE